MIVKPYLTHLDPPRYETGRAMTIVGIKQSHVFGSMNGIADQWQRLVPHLGHIPGESPGYRYGVIMGHGTRCDYVCGVEVKGGSSLPTGFSIVDLARQDYAVFRHAGHVSVIEVSWTAIWSKWLPAVGRQPASAPAYERFGPEYDRTTGWGGCEIWLPIKPA